MSIAKNTCFMFNKNFNKVLIKKTASKIVKILISEEIDFNFRRNLYKRFGIKQNMQYNKLIL